MTCGGGGMPKYAHSLRPPTPCGPNSVALLGARKPKARRAQFSDGGVGLETTSGTSPLLSVHPPSMFAGSFMSFSTSDVLRFFCGGCIDFGESVSLLAPHFGLWEKDRDGGAG